MENNEIIGYEKIEHYNPERTEKLMEHYRAILQLLGEDPSREGLLKTPLRVAKSMQFLTQGYNMDPMEILLSARFKEDYRQMVIVKDIELFSMCEHHMCLPDKRNHVVLAHRKQLYILDYHHLTIVFLESC